MSRFTACTVISNLNRQLMLFIAISSIRSVFKKLLLLLESVFKKLQRLSRSPRKIFYMLFTRGDIRKKLDCWSINAKLLASMIQIDLYHIPTNKRRRVGVRGQNWRKHKHTSPFSSVIVGTLCWNAEGSFLETLTTLRVATTTNLHLTGI